MNPTSTPQKSSRRLSPLLLGVSALALFGASCATTPVACEYPQPTPKQVYLWHETGRFQVMDYDVPVDYLSGKWRQLYRAEPHWFRTYGAPSSYYGK